RLGRGLDGRRLGGRDHRFTPCVLDLVAGKVALDYAADGRQQRRHVAAVEPSAAARVEHRLQLIGHEGDVAAAAEYRRDHARQPERPGVVLHVLGVDEDLEGTPLAAGLDVVDGDVDRVGTVGPLDLV